MRRWLPCRRNGDALLRNRFLNEPNPGIYYNTHSADMVIVSGWGDVFKKLEITVGNVIIVKVEMVCGRICLDVVNIDKW
jgi:hypothetical protein